MDRQIKHLTHAQHPLTYHEKLPEEDMDVEKCILCLKDCDADLYLNKSKRKKSQNFRLHRRCAEQPKEITLPDQDHNLKFTIFARRDVDYEFKNLTGFENLTDGMLQMLDTFVFLSVQLLLLGESILRERPLRIMCSVCFIIIIIIS